MSTQTEKSSVEQLIAAYAEAVNKGDRKAISTFYTEDGLLFPEGFKPVLKGKSRDTYFADASVNISFSVKEIVVEGTHAFVEARANTKIIDRNTDQEFNKMTRDVFILRNNEGAWKIYRYIFNSENKA